MPVKAKAVWKKGLKTWHENVLLLSTLHICWAHSTVHDAHHVLCAKFAQDKICYELELSSLVHGSLLVREMLAIERIIWRKFARRSLRFALAYYLDMGFTIFPKDVLMGDMQWSSWWIKLWQNSCQILPATTLHLIGIDLVFVQVLNAPVQFLILPWHTPSQNKVCSLTPSTVNLSRNWDWISRLFNGFPISYRNRLGKVLLKMMVVSACCAHGSSWHWGVSPQSRSLSTIFQQTCRFGRDAEPLRDMANFNLFQRDIETTESRLFECRRILGCK